MNSSTPENAIERTKQPSDGTPGGDGPSSSSLPSSRVPLYAGFWRRGAASCVDGLVLLVPNLASSLATESVASIALGWTASAVVGWLYFGLFHASGWQATPGKRALGIKVTNLGGERIGFGRATGRYFATWISTVTLMIGYLMAAFTERRQALHDKIAGTLVIRAKATREDVAAGGGVMPITWGVWVLLVVPFIAGLAAAFAIPIYRDQMRHAEIASLPPVINHEAEEVLTYAIYSLALFSGGPTLVGEGKRTYAHSEVRTLPGPATTAPNWEKVLSITDEFEIWASVYREPRVDGFGLFLKKNGQGFSWEWFDRDADDVFHKRQGGGRVKVRFAHVDGMEELAEVQFLDDITMRLDRFWFVSFTNKKSDQMIVRKGSVLWLAL